MSVPVPEMGPSRLTVSSVSQLALSRVRADASWSAHLEMRLQSAIQKWVSIVLEDPLSFDVGRRCALRPAGMLRFVRAYCIRFREKSSGTLHNRAGPLLRFLSWAKRRQMRPLPLRECDVYEFLLDLEDASAPSFGKALLSSIAFCKLVLGAEGLSDVLNSGRLVGLARSSFLKKKEEASQASFDCSYGQEAGATCRGRAGERCCSDGQGLKGLMIDEPDCFMGPLAGYFQGAVSRTKTSFSLERKTALLPMVGPLCGVAAVPWFKAWLGLREDMGIPEGEDFPLLPSRGQEGGWSPVPPSATVAAGWLRGISTARGFS